MGVGKVLQEAEHGLAVGAADVLHGVEKPFLFAAKVEKVMATIIDDKPELQSVLTELVTEADSIGISVLADIGEKGLNLGDDAATLAQVKKFFAYFETTVKPAILKIYGEIKEDALDPINVLAPVAASPEPVAQAYAPGVAAPSAAEFDQDVEKSGLI